MIGVNKNFPYDIHSVWNRNQLGTLDLTNPLTLGILAIVGYLGYKYYKTGSLSF